MRKDFIPGADANDLILQARAWEHHDVGATKGFDGNIEEALASIKVPVLYMPSETDLYLPVSDARYEARFIPHVTLTPPVPSLWGHPSGIGISPEDKKFVNETIAVLGAVALRSRSLFRKRLRKCAVEGLDRYGISSAAAGEVN